jgi:methyltransferase (TIGR00027 family)
MPEADPLIRHVSDTAHWVAYYRALETDRPDALFRDPHARRLAGERGARIAAALPGFKRSEWALVTRTVLFDAFIRERVAAGVDTVVNLAAGLDARPYRMDLPPALRWVEVDLPEILDEKETILGDAKPVCAFERVRLDLADVAARRDLFARLGRESKNALVVSEGLLIYLDPGDVAALARDLAAAPSFRHWAVDIQSPGLMRMLAKDVGSHLDAARSPFKFAPPEGPPFFEAHGWRPVAIHPIHKAAAKLNRLNFWMKLLAMLPDSEGRQGKKPWAAVCLLERGAASSPAAAPPPP